LVAVAVIPPLGLLVVLASCQPQPGRPWFWLSGGLTVLGAALGAVVVAWCYYRQVERQVDTLIDHCHALALGGSGTIRDWPLGLDQLSRLGMAIQVLREALVDYLSLYRRFFEAAPDMFLSLSPAGGRILDANQAFCQAVGRLKSEVLGQPVDRFVTLEQGWGAVLAGREGLHKGQIATDRGIMKIEANISLERGPEDQPWILGAILRDVTQQEELHRELIRKSTALEKALEEIKDVEELKDQFLTTLSHELKTPLVALKGFLQLLRQGQAQGEQAQEYLDICWRNLTKLERQINNLLDLARLSHAKEQFEMGPVELDTVVRTEAENLRPVAAEKQVRMELALPPHPVVVRGNAEKLVQLVDNLLMNAIKYNEEGGSVRVVLREEGGQVQLEVSDSGVGMAREQMAKIFNRFYRAEVSGSGRLEGLGIGLSLVQEIVRLHGGDIRVESQPGVGTTFTVTLEARS
jgi:PAS domain S-box-containing protein